MITNRSMGEEDMVCLSTGILCNHKNKKEIMKNEWHQKLLSWKNKLVHFLLRVFHWLWHLGLHFFFKHVYTIAL